VNALLGPGGGRILIATSAAGATLTCDDAYGLWSLEQTLAKRRIFSCAKIPCGCSGVNEVRRT